MTLSNRIIFWQFLAHRYRSKFATKLHQNCQSVLTTVSSNLVKRNISQFDQFVHNSSNVRFKSDERLEEDVTTMFKVFAFGFETRIKTISPLIMVT